MQSLILMTGFNGEKYICEQIESICRQTLKDWHLLIRDDGSSDKTIDIIRSFMAKDSRIELIKNETEQHGAYLNFWTLIEYAKALYFILALPLKIGANKMPCKNKKLVIGSLKFDANTF